MTEKKKRDFPWQLQQQLTREMQKKKQEELNSGLGEKELERLRGLEKLQIPLPENLVSGGPTLTGPSFAENGAFSVNSTPSMDQSRIGTKRKRNPTNFESRKITKRQHRSWQESTSSGTSSPQFPQQRDPSLYQMYGSSRFSDLEDYGGNEQGISAHISRILSNTHVQSSTIPNPIPSYHISNRIPQKQEPTHNGPDQELTTAILFEELKKTAGLLSKPSASIQQHLAGIPSPQNINPPPPQNTTLQPNQTLKPSQDHNTRRASCCSLALSPLHASDTGSTQGSTGPKTPSPSIGPQDLLPKPQSERATPLALHLAKAREYHLKYAIPDQTEKKSCCSQKKCCSEIFSTKFKGPLNLVSGPWNSLENPEGIGVMTGNGKLVVANEKFMHCLGLSLHENIGNEIDLSLTNIKSTEKEKERQIYDIFLETDSLKDFQVYVPIRNANNHILWVYVHFRKCNDCVIWIEMRQVDSRVSLIQVNDQKYSFLDNPTEIEEFKEILYCHLLDVLKMHQNDTAV